MLGTLFLSRERNLARAPEAERLLKQYLYATDLLASVLERAEVLASLSKYVDEFSTDRDEYLDRLQNLQRAVETFTTDCDETALRGRRARLFGARANGQLDATMSESEESLATIGGAVVPEDAG
jgi:hypothetical protein